MVHYTCRSPEKFPGASGLGADADQSSVPAHFLYLPKNLEEWSEFPSFQVCYVKGLGLSSHKVTASYFLYFVLKDEIYLIAYGPFLVSRLAQLLLDTGQF